MSKHKHSIASQRRAPQLPPPDRIDDPDIVKAMTVDVLQVPGEGHFKRYITEEELADLDKRDRKTVLGMSEMEQWSIWHTEQLAKVNHQIRRLEAENIRLSLQLSSEKSERRREVEGILMEQRQQSLKWSIAKWSVMTLTAALAAALLRTLIEHLGK